MKEYLEAGIHALINEDMDGATNSFKKFLSYKANKIMSEASHCNKDKIDVVGFKNPVAKNMNKFNKSVVQKDKKSDYTRKPKHKNKSEEF
jgi:hypothetical protein